MINVSEKIELSHIPDILSFFGLGASGKTTPITDSLANHNYLVSTVNGEFVIKFLITQKKEVIKNDIAIQKQLLAINVKTPIYLSNKNNNYIYKADDVVAVASRKIEGIVPKLANEQLAFSIGQVLAKFHIYVFSLPYPTRSWLYPDKREMQNELAKNLYTQSLPKGIIHGDMHLGNIHILKNEPNIVHAIFDFEEAGEDLFIVDVARSIIGVCFSDDGNSLLPDLVKAELAGYEFIRKLNENEKQILPIAIQYATKVCIEWFAKYGFERYIDSHKKRAESFKNFWLSQTS